MHRYSERISLLIRAKVELGGVGCREKMVEKAKVDRS